MKTNVSLAGFQTHQVSSPSRRFAAQLQAAFTRVDLFVVLATTVVLAGLVLPIMANTRGRSEQVICANNLRQLGQGIRSWASDHGNMNSWRVPSPPSGGEGTKTTPKSANVYLEFNFLRRQLSTPQILVCPSDTNRHPAVIWSQLVQSGFRNLSVSYFIGVDALFETPFAFLSGDRNLNNSGFINACSSGITANLFRLNTNDFRALWTNTPSGWLHYPGGNLLYNNGVVQQVPNQSISNAINPQMLTDGSSVHVMYPGF